MPPSWVPMCLCMQQYCEPYFTAVSRWRKYEDEAVLINRIQLVEAASYILSTYSTKADTYVFSMEWENDVAMLAEVEPSSGRVFKVGGDKDAYAKAMAMLSPEELFVHAGMFFQDNLLKSIAGWNQSLLEVANTDTRSSIIHAIDKLLRLPEAAGKAHFTYFLRDPPLDGTPARVQPIAFPLKPLTEKGEGFRGVLWASLSEEEGEEKGASAEEKIWSSYKEEDDSWEEKSDGELWSTKHPSVGTMVAAWFPAGGGKGAAGRGSAAGAGAGQELYTGRITSFSRATKPSQGDQLYHVEWADGDEQDLDDKEFNTGRDLFDLKEGWTSRHPSVGTKCAAMFADYGKKRLFQGTVRRYAPAEGEEGCLYHVVWEDGDVVDYNQTELDKAVALLEKHTGRAEKEAGKEKRRVSTTATATAATLLFTGTGTPYAGITSGGSAAGNVATAAMARVSVSGEKAAVKAAAAMGAVLGAVVGAKGGKGGEEEGRGRKRASPPSSSSSSQGKVKEEGGGGGGEGSAKKRKKKEPEAQEEEEPQWTQSHDSVGTRVVELFGRKKTPFGGVVVKYAPPSGPSEEDQLYHVYFDDGDEQDLSEKELKANVARLERMVTAGDCSLQMVPKAVMQKFPFLKAGGAGSGGAGVGGAETQGMQETKQTGVVEAGAVEAGAVEAGVVEAVGAEAGVGAESESGGKHMQVEGTALPTPASAPASTPAPTPAPVPAPTPFPSVASPSPHQA